MKTHAQRLFEAGLIVAQHSDGDVLAGDIESWDDVSRTMRRYYAKVAKNFLASSQRRRRSNIPAERRDASERTPPADGSVLHGGAGC